MSLGEGEMARLLDNMQTDPPEWLTELRGEMTVAELCRKEGLSQSLYYKWSKEFLEAGKQRLAGNTSRQATSNEVKTLRNELEGMKMMVAELSLKNRVLKKSLLGTDSL